tara:strand:+ start:9058 stop:9888 length:831 start_codon:yes stop_codon:yes gene_type:complete
MIWFNFSLLKYLPDPKRGEIINVGIVIYRSSGVDVRLLNNASKIRMFDGSTSYNELTKLNDTIKKICGFNKEPQEQFERLKTFGTGIFINDLSSFSIPNIGEYEFYVSQLFNELVRPHSSREPRRSNSRFFTRTKNEFKKYELLAKDDSDIDKHKIVPHYPIDTNSGLEADFMLKNGKYHMSELIDFNVENIQPKFKETSLKTMTFITGRRLLADNMGCYFVYSASTSKDREIIPHLNLAEDNCDKMFNLDSSDEKAAYFQLLSELTGNELPLNLN